MRLRFRVLSMAAMVATLVPVCGSAPGVTKTLDEDIVVTAAPVYEPLAVLRGEERFPQGAQLLLVHQGNAAPLVKGFAASADANISFDGKSVLFAGKQAASDPWQIWELTLADGSVRRLIANSADAIRPLYLPAGQLVYAGRTSTGYRLVVAGKASLSMMAPDSRGCRRDVASHFSPAGKCNSRGCAAGWAHSVRSEFSAWLGNDTGAFPGLLRWFGR